MEKKRKVTAVRLATVHFYFNLYHCNHLPLIFISSLLCDDVQDSNKVRLLINTSLMLNCPPDYFFNQCSHMSMSQCSATSPQVVPENVSISLSIIVVSMT